MAAPNLIMPIMVLNVLGVEAAAYYYIAYAIAALLFMIEVDRRHFFAARSGGGCAVSLRRLGARCGRC